MEELTIHRYQADQIKDTLRIVANILDSRNKKTETCADRCILKSIEHIDNVINKTLKQ